MESFLVQAVAYTVGGILVAGAHELTTRVNPDDHQNVLQVGYNHLHTDTTMLDLLLTIEPQFHPRDQVAYWQTVKASDALVGLRTKVRSPSYVPCMNDRVQCILQFKQAKDAISRFFTSLEVDASVDPRCVIGCHAGCKRLIRILESYVDTIAMSTRDIFVW